MHDKPLPQAEDEIRGLFRDLSVRCWVLVVVYQPASIGTFAVAVARDLDIDEAWRS